MKSPTGNMLDRHNYHVAVDCAVPDGSRSVSLPSSVYNPLSKEFIIPPDVYHTPYDLVRYFERCMWRKSSREGVAWGLPRSSWSYLRSAKTLIDDVGFDMAVRAVCHGVRVSNHCPSFKFISSTVPQIQESLQR